MSGGLQSRLVRLERRTPGLGDPFAHLSDSALEGLCAFLNAARDGETERAEQIASAQLEPTLSAWRRTLEAFADA